MKVIKTFMDKKTKVVYRPGDEYEGSKARLQELSDKGYVEPVKEEPEPKTEGKSKDKE